MQCKIFHRLIFYGAIVLATLLALSPPALTAEGKCKIAIVKSRDLSEDNIALEGFFEVMAEHDINCETSSFDLRDQMDQKRNIASEIQKFEPDIILTVGSISTRIISKSFKNIPIVFTMLLYPVASEFVSSIDRPGKNVTGSAMDVPIKLQLQALSRMIPKMKRIGVLYTPEETLPIIENAKHVAESMNLELLAERVDSESDVPDALSKLDKQKIDALWSVADGNVFTPHSIKYIILYVARRGLPFMVPHYVYVEKSAALVALTVDYRDHGRQAGEISIRILDGKKPADIPVATARKVEMALNLHAANNINLKIPQDIIDEASKIFE
jgi:putative ABC transport system substrate-binding protein